MKSKLTLLSYQITYKGLNKQLFEKDPEMFEKVVLLLRAKELLKTNSKIKKRSKVCADGIKITFEALKSDDDFLQEVKAINEECVKLDMPELLKKKQELKS